MKRNRSEKRERKRAGWIFRFAAFAGRHWFNGFAVFFVLHLFLFKEVSIQVSVHSVGDGPDVYGESATGPQQKEPLMVTTTYDGELPLDNEHSNLSFLLNPRLTKGKGVPPKAVREKMGRCQAYVERFGSTARGEQKKFGIPASIILAQALLESNAGDNLLAREFRNHFAIRCRPDCQSCTCKGFIESGGDAMYRVFRTPWESFRQHSLQLKEERFQALQSLENGDYKAWARGLMAAGYNTDPDYVKKLITVIEMLDLNRYDL